MIMCGIKVHRRYNNTHKSQNIDRRKSERGSNAHFRVSHERFRVRANGICDPPPRASLSTDPSCFFWSVVQVRDRYREGIRHLTINYQGEAHGGPPSSTFDLPTKTS